LAIQSIHWFIMRNWVTISLSPLCSAMLLLASNISECENWLADKKYIFLTHSLTCLNFFHISLKYACYAFFLSSHLFSALTKLKSTPNIIVLTAYPNICIWLKN
jgi:hypothetical protein